MDHGITTWPTRVISKKAKLSEQDLNRIADWLNDTHDSGSIHSSYWERVESVKLYMVSKYKKGKQACLAQSIILGTGYAWTTIQKNFLSEWFTPANMKKAATLITALEGKPKVCFIGL